MSKSKNRGPAPSHKTVSILIARAGGRCQFENCNKNVFLDEVTLDDTNDSNVAHIIASSPDGPRGSKTQSFEMSDKIENLKALILSRGETPEFTHNITKLAKRCEDLGIELPEMLDDISDTLTLWESSVKNDPFIVFSEKKYSKAKTVYSDLKIQISNMFSGFKNNENFTDEIEDGVSDGLHPTM